MPLFDLNEFLPAHEVQKRTKKPFPGTPAHNKKFDEGSKVARIPATWDIDELVERIEVLQSTLATVETELAEARARSSDGQLSNRYEKLAQFVSDIRDAWPAGDAYDPFRNL